MGFRVRIVFLALVVVFAPYAGMAGEGIAPEQIFQSVVDWNSLIGTWEVLPAGNPLDEKSEGHQKALQRILMTLRKDGTCRIFNHENPTGSDGLWTFEDHDMSIKFKNGNRLDFFIYGIKGNFMVTRSPVKEGNDQLWSRIK
jgi:hypothetical protein